MHRITVLMSTFNGEAYLEEQINSILKQVGVEVKILIRDDGSTDKTLKLLNKLAKERSEIEIIKGKNIGWRGSFSQLLQIAGDSDYYAFSDQDDYWEETKLISAIDAIKDYSCPVVYRGRSFVADEALKSTGLVFQDCPIPSVGSSFFVNFCQGCTLVFNKRILELYRFHPIPNVSHDIWIPLLGMHLGKIVDDKTPHMLYRVHSNNATMGKKSRLAKKVAVVFSNKPTKYNMNFGAALYDNYKDLINKDSLEMCYLLKNYKSIKCKLKLLFSSKIKCFSLSRTLLVKYKILFNGLVAV